MKKTYVFIVLLVSTYSCKAQLNELSLIDFEQIKFNNVSIEQIQTTNANTFQMRALFGDNLQTAANTTTPSLGKNFWNNDVSFGFEDDSDTGNQYSLYNIFVRTSSINIEVKGITVRLGDNISIFGNNIVVNTNNGDNSIVFIDKLTGSAALAFKIDKTTNKITKIVFNAYD